MNSFLNLLAYLRTLLLVFRVFAFERTATAALVLWAVLCVPFVLAMATLSWKALAVSAVAALVLLMPIRAGVRSQRYRLVRVADRIEFADAETAADDVIQRFGHGVVLQRMHREAAQHSGADALLQEGRWFFLVRTPERTRIVALDMIVSIETDIEEE